MTKSLKAARAVEKSILESCNYCPAGLLPVDCAALSSLCNMCVFVQSPLFKNNDHSLGDRSYIFLRSVFDEDKV